MYNYWQVIVIINTEYYLFGDFLTAWQDSSFFYIVLL